MNLWDSLGGLLKTRTAERVRDYEGLVRSVAAGGKNDPTLTLDILERAGKSIDDLRVAVEAIHRRRKLVEEYKRLPTVRAELTVIVDRCDTLKAEAVAFRAKQQAEYDRMAPTELALRNEEHRLLADVGPELETSAENPDALAARVAAEATIQELERRRQEHRDAENTAATKAQRLRRERDLATGLSPDQRATAAELETQAKAQDAEGLRESQAAEKIAERDLPAARTALAQAVEALKAAAG